MRSHCGRRRPQVKENVFTFFSSGIGGPHEYKGNDMVVAHEKMAKEKPITEAAFHALTSARKLRSCKHASQRSPAALLGTFSLLSCPSRNTGGRGGPTHA